MSPRDSLLLITTSYPRWSNGREAAGSFVADLAAALSARVNVRVVAPGDSNSVEQVSTTLVVYRYAAPERRLVNLKFWHPRDVWRIVSTLRAGKRAVRRAAADGRVKHILALWALPPGWWARSVGRKRHIPYSIWALGSDIWSLGRLPLVRRALRRAMLDAERRYADGLQLARDGQAICGLDVEFLPTTRALNARDIEPPADHPPYRFAFIGRWHRNKGVDLLLDALALLGNDDWSRIGDVAIYGGGPLSPLVQKKSQLLMNAGRPVTIGGFIPKHEAERIIMQADWVVIPSRIESIPLVFSDAMKLRRPVVAMPVGDLSGLMQEADCGIQASGVSAAALCLALQSALGSNPRSLARGVAEMAARFDLNTVVGKILDETIGRG